MALGMTRSAEAECRPIIKTAKVIKVCGKSRKFEENIKDFGERPATV
jgi:hypothetical protein